MLSSYKGFDYTGLMSPEFVPLDIPSAETPTPEPPKSPVEPSVSSPQGAMTALEAQEAGNPAWEQLTAQQKGTVPIQRDIRQMTPEQQDIMGGAARITEANKQAALDAGVPQSVVDRALQWGVNIKAAGWGPEIPVTGGLTEAEFATQGVTRWGEATGVSPIGVPSTEAGVTTPSGVMPPGAGIPTQPQKPTTIEPTQASKYAWDTYYAQEEARLQQEEDQQIAKIEANYAVKGVVSKVAGRMGAGNIADLKKQYAAQREILTQEKKIVNAQLLPWYKEGSLNVAPPQTPKRVFDLPPTRDSIYKRYGLPEPTPKEQGGDGWTIPISGFQHNIPNAYWFNDGTIVQATDENDFRNFLLSMIAHHPISHSGQYEDPIETSPYEKLLSDSRLAKLPTATKANRQDFRLEMMDEVRAGNITQELYNAYFEKGTPLEEVYVDSGFKLGSPVSFKPVIRQISSQDYKNEQAKLEPFRYKDIDMVRGMGVIYDALVYMQEVQDKAMIAGEEIPPIPDNWINETELPYPFATGEWASFNPKTTMDIVKDLADQMKFELNKLPPPISGWKYDVKISSPNDGDIVTPVLITPNGLTINSFNGKYTTSDGKVHTMVEVMNSPVLLDAVKKEIPSEDIKGAADWLNGQDAEEAIKTIQNMGEYPVSKVVFDAALPPEAVEKLFPKHWWDIKRPAMPLFPTLAPQTPQQMQTAQFERLLKGADIGNMSTMDKIKGIFDVMAASPKGGGIIGTELVRILTGMTAEGKSVGDAILTPMEYDLFKDMYKYKFPEASPLPEEYRMKLPWAGIYQIGGEAAGIIPTPPVVSAAGVAEFVLDPYWLIGGFGISKAGTKAMPYVVKASLSGVEKTALKDALIAGELAGVKLSEKEAGQVVERASTMISKNPEASAKWADVIATKGFNAPEAKGLLKEIAEGKVAEGVVKVEPEVAGAKPTEAIKPTEAVTPEVTKVTPEVAKGGEDVIQKEISRIEAELNKVVNLRGFTAEDKTLTVASRQSRNELYDVSEKRLKDDLAYWQSQLSEVAPKIGEVGGKMVGIDAKLADVKTRLKTAIDKGILERGAINDPESAQFYKDLVEAAGLYIQKGILTVEQFAKELGVKVNDLVQKAWDEASKGGTVPPIKPPKTGTGITPPDSELAKVEEMWVRGRKAKPRNVKESYLKLQEQLNDATYGMRRMQTEVAKVTPIEKGGVKDIQTMLTRGSGITNAGATRATLVLDKIARVAPNVASDNIRSIVYLNHAKEVLVEKGAKRVMAGGFTKIQELDNALSQLGNKLGADQFSEAWRGAEVIKDIYAQELERLIKAGFIDKELGAIFAEKYPWYNPLNYLDDAAIEIAQGKSPKVYTVISSGLKRLSETGTERALQDPYITLAKQLIENEVRIYDNEVAKGIIQVAIENPKVGAVKVKITKPVAQVGEDLIFRPRKGDIPGTISYWEDGVRQVYEVPDWLYNEAVMLGKVISNPVASFFGTLNGISRAAFTSASPPFVVSNMLNDALTAMLRGGILPHDTTKGLIEGLKKLERSPLKMAQRLSGGYQMRFYGKDLEKLITKGGGEVITGKESIASKVWKFIPEAGEIGEQAPRLAKFRKDVFKNLSWAESEYKAIKTPDDAWAWAEKVAATPEGRVAAANNVELTINFGRGAYFVKAANPYVIFLNANMEAMKLPFRTLRDIPASRWRLAGIGAGSAGLMAYNLSYPEYFDIDPNIRWGSVVVMMPSKEKDEYGKDKPNYVTVIPRTREWALFLGSINYAMESLYADKPTEFGQFSATLAPMLMPLIEIPLPQVLNEITQQAANWDFYRSRNIVPESMETLPSEEQTTPWVSPTIEKLATTVGLSPIRTEHAFNGLFGGAGKTFTSITDYIYNMITGEPQKEGEIPVITPIVSRVYPERGGELYRQTSEEFYNTLKELEAQEAKVNNMLLRQDNEGVKKFLIDNRELKFTKDSDTGKYHAANATLLRSKSAAISKLNASIKKINYDPALSEDEKKVQITPYATQKLKIMGDVLKYIKSK